MQFLELNQKLGEEFMKLFLPVLVPIHYSNEKPIEKSQLELF